METKEYITIKEFNGQTKSGFEITHQSQLPKAAKLDRCTYDENYNSYNIYCMIGKTSIKYYILKCKY
jgi:hypothetical protein